MATGGIPSDYQALLELKEELVDRIISSGTDVEVLTTKAVAKGLIPQQSLKAIDASTTARSGKERAEQFAARVLEAIRGNPLGERTTLFLQVLDDLSLSSLSEFIRSKLAGTRRDTSHDPSPSSIAHRPGPSQQSRGGAYGGQPKLEPADEEDSGIAREGVTNNNNDNADFGEEVHVVMNAQHKLAPADTGGAAYTPLSNGVMVVQSEHPDNLAVTSEDDPPGIPETQPHAPNIPTSSSNPMIIGVTSTPVLEQTQTVQENKELRVQMAEMNDQKKCLQEELSQLKVEKEESEQKLKEKDEELKRVEREKDAQIQSLKEQIKEKEATMEELQHRLSHQEQQNEAMKEQHEAEIAKLKKELEEMEEKYHKETLQLTKEKHELELKVEKMHTREEQMRRQSAELKAEVAEEKEKNTKLRAQQEKKEHEEAIAALESQHRKSVSENQQLKDELAKMKRRLNIEPDTS